MKNFCSSLAIYSFLGWIVEGLHHLAVRGTFRKPNFSWAPFKPMYGFAAVALLYARRKGRAAFIIAALTLPTAIEYLSGQWLKKQFNLTYWDYSREKGNIGGLICPKFSVYWSILAAIAISVIDPLLALLGKLNGVMQMRPALNALFISDICCNLFRRCRKH